MSISELGVDKITVKDYNKSVPNNGLWQGQFNKQPSQANSKQGIQTIFLTKVGASRRCLSLFALSTWEPILVKEMVSLCPHQNYKDRLVIYFQSTLASRKEVR